MWTRLRWFGARALARFSASRLDGDLNDELDSHLAALADAHIRRGMTPEAARRAARLELGSMTQLREAHRETRGLPWLDTTLQDLRDALRAMRRDPTFTLFAVVIVALGIGASATIFSAVHALLLRPLPFSDPSRLAWVANTGGGDGLSAQTVPVNHFLDLRAHSRSWSGLAAFFAGFAEGDTTLTDAGEPQRLNSIRITQNFLPVLGVRPQIGRGFTDEESTFLWWPFSPKAVMVSHALWVGRFNADPTIVGRRLTLNELPVTVVGVLPATFDFATVFAPGDRIDLYFPMPLTDLASRFGNTLSMIGRLTSGATFESAAAELAVIGPQIQRRDPRRNFQPTLTPLVDRVSGRIRPAMAVLAAGVGVVMLIVCANLSNLLLARGSARQKELAIRAALGAGRARLVRQLLTESVLLSCCGGLAGVAIAVGGTRALASLDDVSIPLLASVRVDVSVLGFTCLVAVATGLVFGIVPAIRTRAAAEHHVLKDSDRGSSTGKAQTWVRRLLVVAEIALACTLLVAAGLLGRSLLRVLDVDLGFEPQHAASLRIDPGARYSTQALRNAHYDEMLGVVRAVSGIDAAGLTDTLPFGRNRTWSAGAKGRPYSIEHQPPEAFVRIVSDGFLTAMGIPLRSGRDFTAHDTPGTLPVIIVNQTLARALWPDQDPIGQTLMYTDRDRVVVGVVSDTRHLALEQAAGAEMYLPIRQTNDYSSVHLMVRTTLPAARLRSVVAAALSAIEPDMPVNTFQMVQRRVDRAVSPRRLVAMLLGGFSIFALLLASFGIYAVVSYTVSQRTQELSIRMALGASARDLRADVMKQTLALAACGIAVGVLGSWFLARALAGQLFGITPADPVTFAGIVAVLVAVAALAGYLPARRASRIDPAVTLRSGQAVF